MNEIKAMIQQMGTSIREEIDDLRAQQDAFETALAKGQLPGGSSTRASGRTSAAATEHGEKFLAWVRKGAAEDALRDIQVQAGMSTQDDPNGGFLVPETLSTEIDRLAPDMVAMRRIAKVKGGLKGDYKRPFSKGGATAGWVGETESRADTSIPELALFQPPWSELYALPKVTQTLLDDGAFDVAEWLLEELLVVEQEYEGAAFISGNGVKKPKGILAYDTVANASWVWGKLGYIASGAASTFTNADKLMSLQHSLKPVYRRNGVWLMNDTTFEHLRKFKDGDGDYLWKPGLEMGASPTLLGHPVEIDDNMPDIGAGTYPIGFGDFKRGYMIGDHAVGRTMLRDPFTDRPYVKLYVRKRTFGGVINFQAIKLLKVASS